MLFTLLQADSLGAAAAAASAAQTAPAQTQMHMTTIITRPGSSSAKTATSSLLSEANSATTPRPTRSTALTRPGCTAAPSRARSPNTI